MSPLSALITPVALLLQAVAPQAMRIEPATISVELAQDAAIPSELGERVTHAVERALLDADFMSLPRPGPSVYVASVKLARTDRGPVTAEGSAEPVTAGPDPTGPLVTVPLPSDKRVIRGLVVTELTVSIRRRSGPAEFWTGRAVTAQVEGSPGDAPATLAVKLTDALFARFPEQMEGPISVP